MGPHADSPEVLNLEQWQADIAVKPFNLKEASEYLGTSEVTLRRWVKKGRLTACKAGRAYTFDVLDLKRFKKAHRVSGDPQPQPAGLLTRDRRSPYQTQRQRGSETKGLSD
jgi:excisionase family DNA binding protein